jgi:hypothetical protein
MLRSFLHRKSSSQVRIGHRRDGEAARLSHNDDRPAAPKCPLAVASLPSLEGMPYHPGCDDCKETGSEIEESDAATAEEDTRASTRRRKLPRAGGAGRADRRGGRRPN